LEFTNKSNPNLCLFSRAGEILVCEQKHCTVFCSAVTNSYHKSSYVETSTDNNSSEVSMKDIHQYAYFFYCVD
jgi:hypothetical protein